jgi:hypothetical protein
VFKAIDQRYPPGRAQQQARPRWVAICVCGHPRWAHPASQGGERDFAALNILVEGCVGPSPGRGRKPRMQPLDESTGTMLQLATCPCREWRPVLELDRPRSPIFWPTVGETPGLIVTLRAFRTSQQRHGAGDSEAEARLRWLPDARVCGRCGTNGSDVWPCYVDDERTTEMRCSEHAR